MLDIFHSEHSFEKETRAYLLVAVVRSLSHVRLFVTPWTTACQHSK